MKVSNNINEILILEEIKNFINPLTKEEQNQLEENIIENGCKDPLTVWERDGDYVLIDGHHRYDICKRNNVDFEVDIKKFDSFEQVQVWMVNNQMGRRNLSGDQLSYYRGKKYLLLKNSHGGFDNIAKKGSKSMSTSKLLSNEFKVGEMTIKRDAKFAEGLDLIGNSNPLLKGQILMGDAVFKKGDIQVLSEIEERQKSRFKVKNEADLHNKIGQIREANIDAIEKKLQQIEDQKTIERQIAQEEVRDKMFLDQEERLSRLKGRILSAINDAITNKNIQAIEELKELIERLQKELMMQE